MNFSGKALHLVAHNVPWPADNGGLLDIYYKIKALVEVGVQVHVHAYVYDRPASEEIGRLCASVSWYRRSRNPLLLLKPEPYIVASRRHPALLKALCKKPLPVVFDTLHTTAFLGHAELQNHPRFVRTHNIEHLYYGGLAGATRHPVRQHYYRLEACKLRLYEKNLNKATGLLAISPADAVHFARYAPTETILPFHPYTFKLPASTQPFALYHGNLIVEENQKAALWLVKKVWIRPEVKKIPLIIAGNGAPEILKRAIAGNPMVQLKENISHEDVLDLVKKARLHVLPTFQATGVKLKLIAALSMGFHILCNTLMVEGTGLEHCVPTADDPETFALMASVLFEQDRPQENWVQARIQAFENLLSNRLNAEKMIRFMKL